MRLRSLSLTLLSLSAVACGDKGDDDTGADPTVDADGDGFTVDVDCDDADEAVYPGAEERCNDLDDDCDSEIDEDPVDGGTFYVDSDGDGFGDADEGAAVVSCELPDGYAEGPDDCDDSDAAVNPSATEICNDLDDDCDGGVDVGLTSTFYGDADRDGYGDDASTTESCDQPPDTADQGGDCDDADETVFPGADEVCGDGVVNDCDGTEAEAAAACELSWPSTAADADLTFQGTEYGENAGYSVSSGGDVDGDGLDDVLVGAADYTTEDVPDRGRAFLILGGATAGGELDTVADSAREGATYQGHLGWAVDIAPDLDGDGLDDVLLGEPATEQEGATGAVFVVLGAASADLSVADGMIDVAVDGRAGSSVAGVGDINGDGLGDLLVGNPSGGETTAGEAYLVLGPATGTLSSADATYSSAGSSSSFMGYAVAGAGDFDGDGLSDQLISEPARSDGASSYPGWFHVLPGGSTPTSGVLDDLATLSVQGAEPFTFFGLSVNGVGDTDGDGLDDIVVSGPRASNEGGQGDVFLILGGTSGSQDSTVASLVFEDDQGGKLTGISTAGAGDLDQDGLNDILVGSPDEFDEAATAGSVYLVLGGVTGTVLASDAAARISGNEVGDGAGYSVSSGDFDGNGVPDLIMGTPGVVKDAGYQEGAVTVLLNELTW